MNSAVRTPFKIHDENSASSLGNLKSGKKVGFHQQLSGTGPSNRDGNLPVSKIMPISAKKTQRRALTSLSTSQVNARTGGAALTPGGKMPAIGLKESASIPSKKQLIHGASKESISNTSAGFSIKFDVPQKEVVEMDKNKSANKLQMSFPAKKVREFVQDTDPEVRFHSCFFFSVKYSIFNTVHLH